MATNIQVPENKLVTELGKLHPDYTIALHQPFNEVFPYLHVLNGKYEVNTQIRLAKHLWTVKILDRLVKKSISKIEATPQPTPQGDK